MKSVNTPAAVHIPMGKCSCIVLLIFCFALLIFTAACASTPSSSQTRSEKTVKKGAAEKTKGPVKGDDSSKSALVKERGGPKTGPDVKGDKAENETKTATKTAADPGCVSL